MNETEINKRFEVLIEQRNNALNMNVILSGELAVARARIEELENQVNPNIDVQSE